jgi:hypothetical protein
MHTAQSAWLDDAIQLLDQKAEMLKELRIAFAVAHIVDDVAVNVQ